MKKLFLLVAVVFMLTAFNDTTRKNNSETDEERNKTTALAVLDAMNKGDATTMLSYSDKDMIEYGDGTYPPVKGIESNKTELGKWLAAVSMKSADLVAVADGDYVMVYGKWNATWKNDFMGMKSTGKTATFNDVDIFKFNSAGKIIEHRYVQPNTEVGKQLGMGKPNQ